MAKTMRIEVNKKDLKRLNNKITNLQGFLDKQIQDIVYQNANLVVNEMKREVPVDTGRLRRNIHATRDSRGVSIESEAISPSGRKIDYAPIIENYGGRFSKGQFYFSKAIIRLRNRVMSELKTGLKTILNNRTGSTLQRGRVRTYTPSK